MFRSVFMLAVLLSFQSPARAESAVAVFAGGCFWCMESFYQEVEGVSDVVSGFTGGESKKPTYKGDHKGHYEAVKVTYDPKIVSYAQLLDSFWHNIDPFDSRGQFCDKGPSYLSAIFVGNEKERELAEKTRAAVVERFPKEIVQTPILDAGEFWPVEEGHQDYYIKNPVRYKYYRWNCGRDQRLEEIWGRQAGN
ncbi:MAG: peptide-methionine (S)-S-oxide reductase MsrA [Halioglobus sp.]